MDPTNTSKFRTKDFADSNNENLLAYQKWQLLIEGVK